jgi:hypothetical protein
MDQLRQGELRAAFEQFKYAEAWSAKWAKSAKEIWDVYQQKLGDIYIMFTSYVYMYIYIYICILYILIYIII